MYRRIGLPPCGLAAMVFMLIAGVMPAQAADPIFPTASRLGLVPPPGMTLSKSFAGFEDADKDAAILLAAQPAAAYADIEKNITPEALKKEGITFEKRDTITLGFGRGVLISGRQTGGKTRYRKWLLVAEAKDLTALANAQVPEQEKAYSDATMRSALMSLAVRDAVPDAEKLSLLPFTLGDLAGFRVDSVLPGRAVMLADEPGEPPHSPDVRLFVAAFAGGPRDPQNPGDFARVAFEQIVGIKDVQITMSEPLRLGGQPGFQTLAQAKDATSDKDIMVAQWLRFGGGGFLQMIGIARADLWVGALARFRQVRDSVQIK